MGNFANPGAKMNARDAENQQLDRCVAVASDAMAAVRDRQEANVFRVAAMVLQSRFPSESMRLMQASNRYFDRHPADLVSAADVVRNRWVVSLPRLRNMLSVKLEQR